MRSSSLRDQRETKEELVLSYAKAEKLTDLLLTLGFFSQARLMSRCPNREKCYYTDPERIHCKAISGNNSECVWNWNRVGQNPDCPLDGQLEAGLDAARSAGVKGILEKTVEFALQEIHGKHAVDIAVRIPEVVDANQFFVLTDNSPTKYFLIFDLELGSALKAIRFIRLLSNHYSSDASKPQPILVTLNTDQKLRETIEGQGIKVYNPR